LFQDLGHWENSIAFECGLTGRAYTHLQVYQLSRNFAAALINSGLKKKNVIAMFLPNLPEFSIAMIGSWQAGLTITLANPLYTPSEIGSQLKHCEAKCIVTIPLFLPVILEAKKLYPKELSSAKVIIIGEAQENCHSFFEMLKTNSQGVKLVDSSDPDVNCSDDVAMLPFSSGTTGPPKAVMLTHFGLLNNIAQITQPEVGVGKRFKGGNRQEKALGLLPFFHAMANSSLALGTLHYGAHTVVVPKFEPNSFIQLLQKHEFTILHLVTPLISFLVNHPQVGSKELKKLDAVVGGAAPIGNVLISKLLEKAGHYVFFQEAYGMTELSPCSHMVLPETKNTKVGSCGTPLPSTLCKVIDVESGKTLGANQEGEILVKGPQVMKGYYKNEAATAATIDSDGWLHTGDIGYYDEDKCFYIVDRLKDLIKVKGLQVSPSEIENVLREHPDIADVAVIGVPDEESGELPRAFIVKQTDSLSEAQIHDFLKDKLASFKQLRGGIHFIPAVPKAASGKILRKELKLK